MKEKFNQLLTSASSVFLMTSVLFLSACPDAGKDKSQQDTVAECAQFDNQPEECSKHTTKSGEKCGYDIATKKCLTETIKQAATECAKFDTDKAQCNTHTTTAGIKCQYDDTAKKCQPEVTSAPPAGCENLDETACRASNRCTYDAAKTKKCDNADPTISGKCAAYQAQKPCDDNACTWDTTTSLCKDKPTGPTTYYLFDFGAAPSGRISAKKDSIHSVVSSGAGAIYVVGENTISSTIDSFDANANIWKAVNLKDTGIDPAGNARTQNYSRQKIDVAASLNNGIIISSTAAKLMGIIFDGDPKVSIQWYFNQAKIAHADAAPTSFFEVKHNNKYYIYAGNAQVSDGISFFEIGSTQNAWKTGYTRDKKPDLNLAFLHYANRPGGGLFLAGANDDIYQMQATAVGSDDHTLTKLLPEDNNKIPSDNLRHQGLSTGTMTRILLVENKFLLVGFKVKNAAMKDREGGLFWADVTKLSKPIKVEKWQNSGPGYSILDMIEDRTKPGRAVIATSEGAMLFEDGDIVSVLNEKVITPAMVADPKNAGDITDKDKAKTGFSGGIANGNFKTVAQAADGTFYFASDDGVPTLKISSQVY